MLIGLFGIAVDQMSKGLKKLPEVLVLDEPDYHKVDLENASALIRKHPELFTAFVKSSGEPVVVEKVAKNLYDLQDQGHGYSMKEDTLSLARLIANRIG